MAFAEGHCDFFAYLDIRERQSFRNAGREYGMHGIPEGIFDRRFLIEEGFEAARAEGFSPSFI